MKFKSSLSRLVRVVLLTCLLTIAAGCGGNSTDKVKIAIFLPSELASVSKEWQNAANLALKEAGDQAGDTDVEFIFLDESDKSKKEPFSDTIIHQNVEETLKDQSVIAFIGPATSSSSKLVIPILNQASVTNVSIAATWPGLTKPGYSPGEPGVYYPTGQRNFFRVIGADDVQGIVGANWAKRLGYQRVFIINDDDAYGTGLAGVFEITAQDNGLEILGKKTFSYDLSPTEMKALASQILESQPDMIYIAANFPAKNMVLTLRQVSPQTPIMTPDGLVQQELIDLLGGDLTQNMYGTVASLPPQELGNHAAEDFLKNYKKTYGEEPTFFSPLMYDAVGVLLYAISKAVEPTREELLKAMQNLGNYSGVLGTWHFDEQGDISLISASGYQVQDGAWEFVEILR